MKDYIYIDTELLNSNLAQAFEGLPIKSLNEELVAENNNNSSSYEAHGDINIMPAGIGTSFGGKIISKESEALTESQKDVLESAFHDYAVDLLINEFDDKNQLITEFSELQEGVVFKLSGSFTILDFDYISEVTDLEEIQSILSPNRDKLYEIQNQLDLLNKYSKKGKSNNSQSKQQITRLEKQRDEILDESSEMFSIFNLIKNMSRFSRKVFPGTIIIKMGTLLLMLDKKYLRNNTTQINNLSGTTRELTVFGLITTKVDKILAGEDKIEGIKPNDIGSIPSMISNIILSTFEMINLDDYYVKPIAAYFEQ